MFFSPFFSADFVAEQEIYKKIKKFMEKAFTNAPVSVRIETHHIIRNIFLMANFTKWYQRFSVCARAFFFVALIFLLVGLGTAGSAQATGNAFELEKGAAVVVRLDKTASQSSLKQIYLNVGTIYNGVGNTATVKISRSTQGGSGYSSLGDVKLDNLFSTDESAQKGVSFNWLAPYDLSEKSSNSLSSYKYFKLTAETCNLLVNEIVFVADDGSIVPAVIDKEYSENVNATLAASLLDAQAIPSLVQSSFFRYGQEEAYTLTTVMEMRAGKQFGKGNDYFIDVTYGALGTDILALGTLIFGVSPFGLRFFPTLASFGVLVLGYFFAKNLFKSDRAGLIFALLDALGSPFLTLGHLGTPLTLGLFFFTASLYAVYRFFDRGMKEASVKSAAHLLLGGLSGAAAICVNGVFAAFTVGTVGLFVAGMFRQRTAKAYRLSKAENEEAQAQILAEYRYKNRAAILVFAAAFAVGLMLISLLAFLPAYFAYVKAFDTPSAPTLSLIVLMWQTFAGAYGAGNPLSPAQSGWNPVYRLFTGVGESYAVTLHCVNAVAFVAAIASVIFAIVRLILVLAKKESGKQTRRLVRSLTVCLAGVALSVICTIFAAQKLLTLTLAYAFAFLLAGGALEQFASEKAKKVVFIVGVCLLGACFLLAVPFVFSIPLPAAWLA